MGRFEDNSLILHRKSSKEADLRIIRSLCTENPQKGPI